MRKNTRQLGYHDGRFLLSLNWFLFRLNDGFDCYRKYFRYSLVLLYLLLILNYWRVVFLLWLNNFLWLHYRFLFRYLRGAFDHLKDIVAIKILLVWLNYNNVAAFVSFLHSKALLTSITRLATYWQLISLHSWEVLNPNPAVRRSVSEIMDWVIEFVWVREIFGSKGWIWDAVDIVFVVILGVGFGRY